MLLVQRLTATNAEARRVLGVLGVARVNIEAASQQDPTWRSLRSGVEAVQQGLQRNDLEAATLGMAISRDQCRLAGVYLQGAIARRD